MKTPSSFTNIDNFGVAKSGVCFYQFVFNNKLITEIFGLKLNKHNQYLTCVVPNFNIRRKPNDLVRNCFGDAIAVKID